MEEKQLNFDQPLLSVRRYSSTVSTTEAENKRKPENAPSRIPLIPMYKSELKSGPVRNPGTVPFVWEQMPGRPKDERKPQLDSLQWSSVAPKIPPGRNLNVTPKALDEVSESTAPQWSQSRSRLSNFQNSPSVDKNSSKGDSNQEGIEGTVSSSSEEGDEAYVDAVDTLSRSESFFSNCSISGVSGLDGTDSKRFGTCSTDPQARDFMIGRFLPAAKAMASETPQHSTRRQLIARERPIAREQTRQIKKAANVEKRNPLNQYRAIDIPHYVQANEVEESDVEDDDYGVADSSSHKVCGLFPRLCLQNSFCLLTPVPGMRKPAKVPIRSAGARKVKSSYASFSESGNKERNAEYEKRLVDIIQTKGSHEEKKELKGEADQLFYKCDRTKYNGSSPRMPLEDKGRIAFHNELFEFGIKEAGFLGIPKRSSHSGVNGSNKMPKGGSNFRELLANESNEWASVSGSPEVERTLYVDSVHMVKSQNSNSSSITTEDSAYYRKNSIETLAKGANFQGTVPMDSSLRDIMLKDSMNEKSEVLYIGSEYVDSRLHKSVDDVQVDVINADAQHQGIMQDKVCDGKLDLESQPRKEPVNTENSVLVQDSTMLTMSKVANDCSTGLKTQLCREPSGEKSSVGCNQPRPIPPPLPKSPSESWLMRTLPAVTARNSSTRSFLGMNVDPIKTNTVDSKWEMIVKTSNVQHGHLRFSEELLAPIPES